MIQDRLHRIRLLSSRFQELHGLRVSIAGAAIAAAVGGYLITSPRPTDSGTMVALLVSLVPMIPGVWWVNQYYARNFGLQVPSPPQRPWLRWVYFLVYFLVASFLNARFPWIPAGAPTLAVVTMLSLWVVIRDWPSRAYYLLAVAAVAVAFTASASAGGNIDPGKTLALMFTSLGTALVPIGLLDHLLLVRLVKETSQTKAATAASGPETHR